MATYIDFSSEEEQQQSLARLLGKIKNKGKEDAAFVDSIIKLSEQNQNVELFAKLTEESSVLFTEAIENKDVEGFFLVVCSLLKKLGVEAVHQLTPKLLAVVTQSTEDKVLLRLRILNNMYNILDVSPSDRYDIFATAMNFALATRNSELFIPHFKDIDKRIKEWGIDGKQLRDLYKKITDIYKTSKSAQAYDWTVKYLLTFDNEKESEEATKAAVTAALDVIKSPDLFVFDKLLDISAVKRLEDNKTHSAVYQLLKIFVNDTMDAFKAFADSHADFLKSVGLDRDQCTRKLRLLSLATLGAANREIPYTLIAKTLHIDEGEVESWIITAISEGILEAKMDQLKRIVIVTRCIQRVFTKAQWKHLADNLDSWKSNVQVLLQIIQNNKTKPSQHLEKLGLKP